MKKTKKNNKIKLGAKPEKAVIVIIICLIVLFAWAYVDNTYLKTQEPRMAYGYGTIIGITIFWAQFRPKTIC